MHLKRCGYTFLFFALFLFALNSYAVNKQQPPNDARLAMRVTTALAKAKDVPLSEISIHVYKGDVSLCGFVNSKEKRATLQTMKNVQGVSQLYDDLILRSKIEKQKKQGSFKQNISDSWITTKVKQKLITTRDIPGTAISVETYKGNVLLCGYLNNEALVSKSIKPTSQVKGVRHVINGLKVKLI